MSIKIYVDKKRNNVIWISMKKHTYVGIGSSAESLKASQKPAAIEPLKTIRTIFRSQIHYNLCNYKDETIARRLKKRMVALHLDTPLQYAEYLLEHPEEAHLLHQEILIGAGDFYRDKEALNALEDILIQSLEKNPEQSELRIWCLACSTGEEAYSLAILASEMCKRLKKNIDISIYATDTDDGSLIKARAGVYSKDSLQELDNALIEEYFTLDKGGYHVVPSLRQQVLFSRHDLLQDPPLMNQDLINTRNLLNYLLPVDQKETFSLYHQALNPHGILLLSHFESTHKSVDYFTPLNYLYKVYGKII